MTRPSPFSVRGRRALMVMRDDREITIVRRQLNRLGMTISEATVWKVGAPIIALIGTETPSRLKWLLDLQPASFLIKPLRSAGLYTALVVAFDSAQRRIDEAAYIERLEDRIRSRRVVFAAVLQIMRGHGLSETDAFTLIRQTAMRHRTTIEQLSAEIIAVGGMPNRTTRTA